MVIHMYVLYLTFNEKLLARESEYLSVLFIPGYFIFRTEVYFLRKHVTDQTGKELGPSYKSSNLLLGEVILLETEKLVPSR